MNVVFGDLWDELGKADLLLVTGNASVKRNGELVMGRGAAREARDRFPGLALDLGREIDAFVEPHLMPKYGVVVAHGAYHPATRLGVFQVKWHWRDMANSYLIEFSAGILWRLVPHHRRIAMNFPGIGNGGLDISVVEPIVAALPDNVYVYRKP